MSGWLVETKALHAIGGGPARLEQFNASGSQRRAQDAYRACSRGLMRIVQKSPRMYELTQTGWDLCEGRAKISHEPSTRRYSFPLVIGETVSDELIERLLLDAGQIPGQAVSPGVIRAFSAALVAEVRRGA